jgi:hypothetical protein
MTEINHDKTVGFQPELELNLDREPNKPTESRKTPKNTFFTSELETSLDNVWSQLTDSGQTKVLLEPKDSDDPFYIAQLRARELESLQDHLDDVPLLNEGLPFEQKTTPSTLLGMRVRDELNRSIPQGVREARLAFSTFMLTVLEHPTLKQFPLQDSEEMVVTGLFKGFGFDTYDQKDTIVVPLVKPWIHTPRYLRDIELASATIPILSIDGWKWTIPRN